MTEDDARKLCEYTRSLCGKLMFDRSLLLMAITSYSEAPSASQDDQLRYICNMTNQVLGMHYRDPLREHLGNAIDWPIVRSLAEPGLPDGMSAIEAIWRAADCLLKDIHLVLTCDEHDLDENVRHLAESAGNLPNGRMADLLTSEEGRLVRWAQERNGLMTGYLGLMVDARTQTVRRDGCSATVDLSGTTAVWSLFLALYKAEGRALTKNQVNALTGEHGNARSQAKAALVNRLQPLDVTISGNRSTNWKLAAET